MSADLERFVRAQDPAYSGVLDELRRGRKVSHWMWFVFPQLRGLGQSSMAQAYAIDSLAEARAYLAHPTLGSRLRACAEPTAAIFQDVLDRYFGGQPDPLTEVFSATAS
ncbi:MAG: DUF1810 family protein [Chloroflexota bacterium]|nr:MAG: DUF1810 family protein [Chloroflexota bacterium]